MPTFLLTLLGNKWTWIALALGVLTLAVGVQTKRLHSAQAQVVAVQARFDVFVEQTKALGEAQIAKNKEIVAKQEKITRETENSYQRRLSLINIEYARLRDKAGAGAGGRPLSPDATAAKPVDDPARDAELLAVLRAAEVQTGQLIELQTWIKAQDRR